jgi:hypothetical protein
MSDGDEAVDYVAHGGSISPGRLGRRDPSASELTCQRSLHLLQRSPFPPWASRCHAATLDSVGIQVRARLVNSIRHVNSFSWIYWVFIKIGFSISLAYKNLFKKTGWDIWRLVSKNQESIFGNGNDLCAPHLECSISNFIDRNVISASLIAQNV